MGDTCTLQWFPNECARAAKEGWKSLCATNCAEHHLYFTIGALAVAQDKPAGYELGWPERVPSNLTEGQLTMWIYDRAKRLPCIPRDVS